jgi:hypothetical protein
MSTAPARLGTGGHGQPGHRCRTISTHTFRACHYRCQARGRTRCDVELWQAAGADRFYGT